jgi:hypothetical protein
MFEIVLSIIFMLFLLFVFIYAIKKISIIEKEIDSYFEEEQDYLLAFLGEEKYAEYQEWKRENKIE